MCVSMSDGPTGVTLNAQAIFMAGHKEDIIMVLNNVTKFHKILIKNIRLRERTLFQMVNFHKQMAITTESIARYGPLSYLKKKS